MLIIKRQNNEVRYGYVHSPTKQQDNKISSPPLPVLPRNKKLLPFDTWYSKYSMIVDEVTNLYLDTLQEFLEQTERFTCHINEAQFKSGMKRLLYKTSYNNHSKFI